MTKIKWTDESWNPVTGCDPISDGCLNCYAERMAKRLAGRYGYPEDPHHFDVTLHEDKLEEPFKWRKGRMVFVCSMGDLFHDEVPTAYIQKVLDVCEKNPIHTFQVLSKRPSRFAYFKFPPNVWLGVTAENQETADERIPLLLQTNAKVMFISCEPLLGDIILDEFRPFIQVTALKNWKKARGILSGRLDWVIVGGETGPGARTMKADWAWSLLRQCKRAKVPYFFKKIGDAGEREGYPTRSREYPVQ